jgi:hypothetical protein
MPTFRAGLTANQTGITSGVNTKVTFNSKNTAGTFWDTNTNFDAATNYRFTPTVSGYYQINIGLDVGVSGNATRGIALIYKNGSQYSLGTNIIGVTTYGCIVSDIVYFNGSTDYIEAYVTIYGTGAQGIATSSFFSGSMIRAA